MPALPSQGVPRADRLPYMRHHHHHEHAPRTELPPPVPCGELCPARLGCGRPRCTACVLFVRRAVPQRGGQGKDAGAPRCRGHRAFVTVPLPKVQQPLLPRVRCICAGAASLVSRLYVAHTQGTMSLYPRRARLHSLMFTLHVQDNLTGPAALCSKQPLQ